jgi:hypothetical protein
MTLILLFLAWLVPLLVSEYQGRPHEWNSISTPGLVRYANSQRVDPALAIGTGLEQEYFRFIPPTANG